MWDIFVKFVTDTWESLTDTDAWSKFFSWENLSSLPDKGLKNASNWEAWDKYFSWNNWTDPQKWRDRILWATESYTNFFVVVVVYVCGVVIYYTVWKSIEAWRARQPTIDQQLYEAFLKKHPGRTEEKFEQLCNRNKLADKLKQPVKTADDVNYLRECLEENWLEYARIENNRLFFSILRGPLMYIFIKVFDTIFIKKKILDDSNSKNPTRRGSIRQKYR